MKTVVSFLLLSLIAALSIELSVAQIPCFYHWTRGQAGKSGTQTFTGITNTSTIESYNNPLYYSLAAAKLGFNSSTNMAKGRFSGKLPIPAYKGTMKFDFFAKKDQIVITFTKATNTGVITSGLGCYKGIKGTATRTWLDNSMPKYFEWKFCPKAKPLCKPK
jgi:hypothetical protein